MRGEDPPRTYILVGGEPAPEPDLARWARWCVLADRTVSTTILPGDDGPGVVVMTVFLGIDLSPVSGLPLLYETKITGGPASGVMERSGTRSEAIRVHARLAASCLSPRGLPLSAD